MLAALSHLWVTTLVPWLAVSQDTPSLLSAFSAFSPSFEAKLLSQWTHLSPLILQFWTESVIILNINSIRNIEKQSSCFDIWIFFPFPFFFPFLRFLLCFFSSFCIWGSLWYSFGEGNGSPLQYSCLETPTDGEVWWAAVHGVAKSRTWLSDFPFTFHFHALEKVMAAHSSVLAWRIPGMAEPGGLPSLGSHRVGHDWSNLAAAAAGRVSEISF